MPRRYPFRNLIFQGGGIKAFAYLGVLEVLEEYRILEQIERVAGTSAGALLAMLLSFRLKAEDTEALFKTVDYSKIALASEERADADETFGILEREIEKLKGGIEVVTRFVRRFGLYSNDYAQGWLEETIAAHCDGNEAATFGEFRERGFRDLYIVATNLSTRSTDIFCADHTPEVAIADAVLLSGSIPFYFEAPLFDGKRMGEGDIYADGAVLSNYPLHIFDDPKFGKGNRNYQDGINWETLGCRLYTPSDLLPRGEPIENIFDYIENLLETLAEVQVVAFENDYVDRRRTINISDCGIATTDFRIRPDETDPKYLKLVQAGESAARQYLDGYQSSNSLLQVVKEKLGGFSDR